MIAILVNPEAEDWPPESVELAEAAARAAFTTLAGPPGSALELGITLSDNATVQELNRDHRGQDKPTNVLSFPLTDGSLTPPAPGARLLLGDVILAYETVAAEAIAQGKPLADHTAHLVVHGVLHLLGHDHDSDAAAEAMEQCERQVLQQLGIPDPYLDPPSTPDRS